MVYAAKTEEEEDDRGLFEDDDDDGTEVDAEGEDLPAAPAAKAAPARRAPRPRGPRGGGEWWMEPDDIPLEIAEYLYRIGDHS